MLSGEHCGRLLPAYRYRLGLYLLLASQQFNCLFGLNYGPYYRSGYTFHGLFSKHYIELKETSELKFDEIRLILRSVERKQQLMNVCLLFF
jgi:hypothetical protein